MYGFIGTWKWNDSKLNLGHKYFDSQTPVRTASHNNFSVRAKTNGKFDNDKVLLDDQDIVLCVDGLIYSNEPKKNIGELIKDYYINDSNDFVRKIDGVYSLVLYDKKKNIMILATDHTAMKPLYYYIQDNSILFSTDIAWMYSSLKETGKKLSLDYDAAYCLLSYGFMIDSLTLVSGLKKLLPGHYLLVSEKTVIDYKYFDYADIKTVNRDIHDLLDEAEFLFSEAVKKRYNKDLEYGYNHVCTLSGGLDSRSILTVSKDLGFLPQITLTMAQSNTLDEQIAKKISSSIGVGNFFYTLDSGEYLISIDKAVELNGGLVTYPGLMHAERLFSLFNFTNYGAIHSGEVGDAIFGGHYLNEYYAPVDISYGAFSEKLIKKISTNVLDMAKERCNSQYMFFLLERGLNSTVNGWFSATPYTEYTSAFLDKNFLNFILTVPPEYRARSEFYIEWMKKFHPLMCKFKWEKTNTLPTSNKIGRGFGYAKKVISRKVFGNPENMNPYNLWYSTNSNLRRYVEDYYNESIPYITDVDLRNDIKSLYNEGAFTEKAQVLTLLGSIKNYQIEM